MIADRLGRALLERRSAPGTLAEPPDWMWDAFAGAQTHTGHRVDVDSSLRLLNVFSAVRINATIAGSLPLHVYQGAGRSAQVAADSQQHKLLHEDPNSEQTTDQFVETISAHLDGHGNFFAEKVKAQVGGVTRVLELWPLNPAKITVERGRDNRTKVFKVAGDPKSYTSADILHIPAFSYNGLVGLSPIQQAKQAWALQMAREEFGGRFFANNASAGGIVTLPKGLSEDALKRWIAVWNANHRGLHDAGKVGVLEDGATWQDTSIPLKDLEFVDAERWSATQTAVAFFVPPSWLGGTTGDSLTYSTVEGEALHYVKFKLTPSKLVRIEQALRKDRDLFADRSLYPKFNVEGLLRGDSAARASFYTAMTNIGVYSPNDINELEDRPPRAGGDEYVNPAEKNAAAAAPNP